MHATGTPKMDGSRNVGTSKEAVAEKDGDRTDLARRQREACAVLRG